jgi:hypothetical protein
MTQDTKELQRLLDLHQKLLNRLNPCCEDFHHEKNEYHEGPDCPVMEKFEELLD